MPCLISPRGMISTLPDFGRASGVSAAEAGHEVAAKPIRTAAIRMFMGSTTPVASLYYATPSVPARLRARQTKSVCLPTVPPSLQHRYPRLLARRQQKRTRHNRLARKLQRRSGVPRSLQSRLAAEQVIPPIERQVQPVIHPEFLE